MILHIWYSMSTKLYYMKRIYILHHHRTGLEYISLLIILKSESLVTNEDTILLIWLIEFYVHFKNSRVDSKGLYTSTCRLFSGTLWSRDTVTIFSFLFLLFHSFCFTSFPSPFFSLTHLFFPFFVFSFVPFSFLSFLEWSLYTMNIEI